MGNYIPCTDEQKLRVKDNMSRSLLRPYSYIYHILVSIPPYLRVSQFARTLKGNSMLMIYNHHASLKC